MDDQLTSSNADLSLEPDDERRFELVRSNFQLEWERTQHLDSKISNIIGVSGTLLTLFLGLGTFMLERVDPTNAYLVVLRLTLISGLGLFAADALILLLAYRLLDYRFDPNPSALILVHRQLNYSELTRLVTSNIVQSITHNRALNDAKARTITKGLYILWAAIVAVLLFGIFLVSALSFPPLPSTNSTSVRLS